MDRLVCLITPSDYLYEEILNDYPDKLLLEDRGKSVLDGGRVIYSFRNLKYESIKEFLFKYESISYRIYDMKTRSFIIGSEGNVLFFAE